MRRFVDAVRDSLKTCNWYSALFLALCLPDICERLEDPGRPSCVRYEDWFNRYLAPTYGGHFFCPGDFYALRCALVHGAAGDISGQRAKEILDEVCFLSPHSPGVGGFFLPGHCSLLTNVTVNDRDFTKALCLHVDRFCEDLCQTVEKWLDNVRADPDIQARMKKELLTIY